MQMRKVYKSGNSVVLAIPSQIAAALNMSPGTTVNIEVTATNQITVTTVDEEKLRIAVEGNGNGA